MRQRSSQFREVCGGSLADAADMHTQRTAPSARGLDLSVDRQAYTVVEILVVIVIIGLLVAILLPAISAARSAVRRMQCINHERQSALAAVSYATAHRAELPSLWRTAHTVQWINFSYRPALLPYLEEQSLYEQLELNLAPYDPANLPAVSRVVSVYQCPATPGFPRHIEQDSDAAGVPDLIPPISVPTGDNTYLPAARDYAAVYDVLTLGGPDPGATHVLMAGAWSTEQRHSSVEAGLVGQQEHRARPSSFRKIRDGLSHTVILVEQAGPLHETVEGAWAVADRSTFSGLDDSVPGQPKQLFSFHGQGGHVSFADTAVTYLSDQIDRRVWAALLTRNGAEITNPEDWK